MSGILEPGLLSPLGTARQRIDAARAAEYPTHLLAELRDADLGQESLFLAWQLAAYGTALSRADRDALTVIFVRALIDVEGGSTRTQVTPGERALLARAPEVVGVPGDRRPFILDGSLLYQQRLLACEMRLAQWLRARRDAPPLTDDASIDAALGQVIASARPAPSADQVDAVRAALRGRLTVISGGPGTGKTTIVLAILRGLVRLGVGPGAVALAAPTGKAANRLEEAMKQGLDRLGARDAADDQLARDCPTAQTLHRLLGWSPRRKTFAHHQNNRLAQRVVVVDESSMIDLALMERLVRSVAEEARLILLGDADQLPSIEAGAVFRDLTPLAHRLARSHRVDAAAAGGRELAALARGIRDGTPLDLPIASGATARFDGVQLVPAQDREVVLDRWYARQLALDAALTADALLPLRAGADGGFAPGDQARLTRLHAHLHRTRVLCVTRGRPTGTVATNRGLHLRHTSDPAPFAPGEPVMMLRNDYQRGLFNGDQGVIVLLESGDGESEDRPARLGAAFPTRAGWEAWPVDAIGESLELSFAMTVHKAQGSELDAALLLLPEVAIPMLTRELLYTGITRARRAAVICGSAAVLAAGAAAPLVRSSGLAERIAPPAADPT